MGVVYRARQEKLRREVAVKILPGAAFSSADFRQRFQREAETAARLNHPGIVAIYEVGQYLGQPYIAMELVEGPSLAARLSRGTMTPDLAAHVVREVARAVAHAHARSVVHRDLKPSNILLRHDTEPVLTDFGLARFTQAGGTMSLVSAGLGSPGYLPPERAGPHEVPAATAEDVYGLGAVLYHCLTGRPPFVADSLAALLVSTQTQDPVEPRLLNRSLPQDLQTICLRCLEKNPASRYTGACEVADELDRYLRGEPILARPVGPVAKLVRLAGRQPLLAALSLSLPLAIVLGTVAAFIGWEAAAREAEIRRVELYSSDVAAAAAALNSGNPARARTLLNDAAPKRGQKDLRGPEWHLLQQLMKPAELFSVQAHDHILTSLSWSADGGSLLTGAHDGSVKLWRLEDGARLALDKQLLPSANPRVNQLQWLGANDAFLMAGGNSQVELCHLNDLDPGWTLPGQQFALAEKVSLLATSTAAPFYYQPAGKVTLWKMGPGRPVQLETFAQPSRTPALSADGRWLAAALADRQHADIESGVWVRDLQNPQSPPKILATPGPVWSLRFSPDGRQLAVILFQGSTDVLLFDPRTGASLPALHGHSLRPGSVVFTPDSRQIISVSADRTLRCWQQGAEISCATAAHENEIWCADLHPGGRFLASGDKDGLLKLFPFPLPPGRLDSLPRFPHFRYAPLVFTADSKSLMLVQKGDRSVQQPLPSGQARSMAAGPPVAGCDSSGNIWRWDESSHSLSAAGDAAKTWTLPVPENAEGPALKAAMTWGGGFFFTLHGPGCSAVVLNLKSGGMLVSKKLLGQGLSEGDPLKAAALSTDGRFLAVATWHELALHDFKSGETRRFSNDPHWARDIAFSSDSRFMATAGINGHVILRSLPGGAVIATLKGHLEEASGAAFSPDGQTLVSSEIGLGLRFWRLDTLREVLYLPVPDVCETLRFSPDGRSLAVGICPQGAAPESASVLVLPCRFP